MLKIQPSPGASRLPEDVASIGDADRVSCRLGKVAGISDPSYGAEAETGKASGSCFPLSGS